MIAICNPDRHGDAVWSISAARALATHHGCQADFWLSHQCANLADLLEAQTFVRYAIIETSWHMEPEGQVETVGDKVIRTPNGRSHLIHTPGLPQYGYSSVYNLGFHEALALSSPTNALLDYYCTLAGVERQNHQIDIPEGCPKDPVPDGPFVAMDCKGYIEATTYGWYDVLREFVRHCPIPVLEVGRPGSAVAVDCGSIDRTRPRCLEMAGIISKCKYFIGCISASLAIADAFPTVTRIGLNAGVVSLSLGTTSPKNFYPRVSTYQELLSYIEEAQ